MSQKQKIKIGLVSLGCAKNLVDSEVMLGSLLREGCEMAADAREADVVIVNTCGFIEGAKQESIDAVLKAQGLRESGNCRAVIMAGCLTQRYPKELSAQLPDVDAIVGLNEVPRIGEIVREVLGRKSEIRNPKSEGRRKGEMGNGGKVAIENRSHKNSESVAIENRSHEEGAPRSDAARLFWSGPAKYVPDFSAPRARLTPKHFAYVKIAEGCNHPCTFCSIPRIRGRHRSRQMADVLAEVRALVAEGVREINFISQDTTFYGKDLTGEKSEYRNPKSEENPKSKIQNPKLPQAETVALPISPTLPNLLREIQRIEGDFWVRLLYTHPFHWSDELIETMAACDKVCRYVDIPLQHINNEVLERMRRETSGEYIRELVRKIRAGVPEIAIRTTFIVGFPGETEAQFEELLEFIEEARFERLGIFKYSQEDHTVAGEMTGQLSERVKKERFHRAMALQQKVSREVMRGFVGKELRVLVEEEVEAVPKELAGLVTGDLRSDDVRGRRPAHNQVSARQGGKGRMSNIQHSTFNVQRAGWWRGRSHADAPDIDGAVYVKGVERGASERRSVRTGEFARVRIVGAAEYDLVGEVVG